MSRPSFRVAVNAALLVFISVVSYLIFLTLQPTAAEPETPGHVVCSTA